MFFFFYFWYHTIGHYGRIYLSTTHRYIYIQAIIREMWYRQHLSLCVFKSFLNWPVSLFPFSSSDSQQIAGSSSLLIGFKYIRQFTLRVMRSAPGPRPHPTRLQSYFKSTIRFILVALCLKGQVTLCFKTQRTNGKDESISHTSDLRLLLCFLSFIVFVRCHRIISTQTKTQNIHLFCSSVFIYSLLLCFGNRL